MTRRGRALLAAIWAAALAACDGSSTCGDPSRAGFFSGVRDIAGGCYAREERRLSAELAAARARRDSLWTEAEALEAQAESLSREQGVAARRLASVRRNLVELSGTLDRLSLDPATRGGTVAGLRADEGELARRVRQVDPRADDRAAVERLEAENRHLAAQINEVLKALPGATR